MDPFTMDDYTVPEPDKPKMSTAGKGLAVGVALFLAVGFGASLNDTPPTPASSPVSRVTTPAYEVEPATLNYGVDEEGYLAAMAIYGWDSLENPEAALDTGYIACGLMDEMTFKQFSDRRPWVGSGFTRTDWAEVFAGAIVFLCPRHEHWTDS